MATDNTARITAVNFSGAVICLLLAFVLLSCEKKGTETKTAGADELIPVVSHLGIPPKRALGKPAGDGTTSIEVPRGGGITAADTLAADASGDGGGHAKILEELFQSDTDFEKIVAPNFLSTVLVPSEEMLETLEMPGGLRVMRLRAGIDFPATAGLAALQQVRARFGNSGQVAIKDLGGEVIIEQREHSTGITVRWNCTWEGEKLASVRLVDFQEVTRDQGETLFGDATVAALGKTPGFDRQVAGGAGYWSQRLTRIDDMRMTGHSGLAIGDVNGDGLDDLYVCDGGGLPNRLYIQQSDGTVLDASAESRTDWLEGSRGALLVDLDNDGDQDLVVSTVALVLFAENDGSGVFTLRGGHSGSPSAHSLAAADFDLDGDVDIYVCSYGGGVGGSGAAGFEARSPTPFNDAENGGRNVLLRNNGGFAIEDVTSDVGLDSKNSRWSFAAAWEDFDADGDADLYVANDFGRNTLYRNDGGTFSEIAAEVGVEDMASGMSVTWADFNRDTRMDLYVGNMFSSAGKRETARTSFRRNRSEGSLLNIRRMARGNTLFSSSDNGFKDIGELAGVNVGRWAWSSGFADINNDGWEDIVVANGYLTNRNASDL
jgi:hypothetical protein